VLLVLTGGWSIVGIAVNYFHVRHRMDGTWQFWLFLLMKILWTTTAGVVVYSLIRQQRRPASYGFSFRRGGVASLGMLAVIHVYLVISGKLVLSATGDFFLWSVLGAFMEELVFRAIAIDEFIQLMNGMNAKAFWAILASSALWSVPHIPSKSHAQLQGLFLASLIMGYVYYKSKSILLPAWIHVVANAGYLGGILIAALYCLISFADRVIWCPKRSAPLPGAGSRQEENRAIGF
jgi:membrane protease YdiL (CAAX protease family)